MLQKNLINIERQRKTRTYMVILFTIIFSIPLISYVLAQTVTVSVLIEASDFHDCHCGVCFCDPKIYWEVYIDGVFHTSKAAPVVTNIAPFVVDEPPFQQDVDVSKQNIPITIAEYDKSCWPSSDSLCNLKEGPGRRLYLNLDLATCQISGDATGVCGTSITTMAGTFKFKIGLEEPSHTAGLNIRCLHDANNNNHIWPQPGDQVTITAEALDGSANSMPGIVDDIEIWVNDDSAPVRKTSTTPGSFGANQLTFTHTPAAGANQIRYRCRTNDNGQWVSSGWRIVQIGQPASGRAVPILYNGRSDSRVDIVFIADRNDYTGPNDSQFLDDVHTAIRDVYYAGDATIRDGGRYFLFNQAAINFWIALDTGVARDWDSCSWWDLLWGDCLTLPSNWDTKYSFADSGAIVHRRNLRDFAQRDKRIFEAWTGFQATFIHELGHSPVGLADEYCCDGGYWEAYPYPNIYYFKDLSSCLSMHDLLFCQQLGNCLDDPLAAGVPSACQQIQWQGDSIHWFRVESTATLGNDLMQAGQDVVNFGVNPADARRLDWYFKKCRDGGC